MPPQADGLLQAPLAPELIHPALWRAHQLGRPRDAVVPTGFDLLDAELPGGGWPRSVLTELLLPHPGVGEMRLLAPALATVAQGPGTASRSVMLFDPPAVLCGWALAQLGVDTREWIVVQGRVAGAAAQSPPGGRHALRADVLRKLLPSADLFWALEQALRSGHVGAVLAWLPDRLRADVLRRLQLAAQGHDGPVFLLRGIEARCKPSPASLRLALHGAGPDEISLHLLKRRGPALAQPLRLALPPVLPQVLRQRARAVRLQSLLGASVDAAVATAASPDAP